MSSRHLLRALGESLSNFALVATLLLSVLDILKGGFARGFTDFGALVTFRLDDFKGCTLDGFGDGGRTTTVTATLGFFLDTLLIQATVHLSPPMLGLLALHVEGRLGFRR